MQHVPGPGDPGDSCRIPGHFRGFLGIPGDSLGFSGDSWGFLGDSWGFLVILGDSWGIPGDSWGLIEFQVGLQRDQGNFRIKKKDSKAI